MSSFIFVSPDFPHINVNLVEHLAESGVRVLGIGDAEFEGLDHRLKESLTEYYRVSSLDNYDEVYRGVAFLNYKYGKPSRLDSNNSYWLAQDAQLRLDFNIPGINWGASDADSLEIAREAGLPVGSPAGQILSWDAFIGADREVLFEGVTEWPAESSTEYTYRTVSPIPPLLARLGRSVAEALRAKLTFLHVQVAFAPGTSPHIIRISRSAPPAFTLDMHDFAQNRDVYQVFASSIASLDPLLTPEVPEAGSESKIAVYASRQDSASYRLHATEVEAKWGERIRMVERNPVQYRQGMGDTFCIAVTDTNEEADEFVADVTDREANGSKEAQRTAEEASPAPDETAVLTPIT